MDGRGGYTVIICKSSVSSTLLVLNLTELSLAIYRQYFVILDVLVQIAMIDVSGKVYQYR